VEILFPFEEKSILMEKYRAGNTADIGLKVNFWQFRFIS
jgi:hypothetical protein